MQVKKLFALMAVLVLVSVTITTEAAERLTITIGQYQSADSYRLAHEQAGFGISQYADSVLEEIAIASRPIRIDLIIITGAELGMTVPARTEVIYARARAQGFTLCPAEVGPALRLASRIKRTFQWWEIAMEPIWTSDGLLGKFIVGAAGNQMGLYLDGGDQHLPDVPWVFVVAR